MNKFSKIESAPTLDNVQQMAPVLQTLPGDTDLLWSHDLGLMDQDDAEKAVAALTLCGATDWRLPSVEELFLLVDRTKFPPAIDTEYFPDCKADWYRTASPVASNPDCAWVVNFYHGNANLNNRNDRCRVRAVRSVARAGQ